MARFLRTHALSLLLVALAALGTGWVVKTLKPPGAMTVLEAQAMDMTAMQAPPGAMPVAVETLTSGAPRPTLTCTALVEGRDAEDVAATAPGRVLEILVAPGDRVVAGQALVRFERVEISDGGISAQVGRSQVLLERAEARLAVCRSELPAVRADLRAAEVRLGDEARDLARVEKLYGQGALPQDDLQDAEAAHREARAALRARQAELERAAAALERARTGVAAAAREAAIARADADSLRQAIARAPGKAPVELKAARAGQVARVLVTPGSAVLSGAPLVAIGAQGRLRLRAHLSADSVARIKLGAPVTVRTASGSIPAKVSRLISAVSATAGQATVDAEPTGPAKDLVPGDLVEMQVELRAPIEALSVPREALHRDLEGRDFVWLVTAAAPKPGGTDWTCPMHPAVHEPAPGDCPDCRMALVPSGLSGGLQVRKQVVEPGEPEGDRIVVRSGLSAGRVVVQGGDDLREGMAVVLVPWGPTGPETMAAVQPEGQGPYTCPMHPEVVSDEPALCPECHMRLER